MSVFTQLNAVNVNDKTEKKDKMTYLSWPFAWAEAKKRFPDATYEVMKFENGLPYVYDPNTGYMVYTKVTIEGLTHEMWLPVMDGANKAMKSAPYEYKTKYGVKTVEAATMYEINKAIMRCLVKNLAMFGLGLYIYANEDLPEAEPVTCESCGREVVGATSKRGEEWSADRIVQASLKRTGKPLCWDCWQKAEDAAKEKSAREIENHAMESAVMEYRHDDAGDRV